MLHLWHLDEAAAPCADAMSNGVSLTALANGATLGNPSFAGFSNCLNTADGGQFNFTATDKDAALSALPLVSGTGDDAAITLADAASGAFTMEALVRVDFDPTANFSARASGMQIISGEGDLTADRIFQFRLEPIGYGTVGDTNSPRLNFINLRQGATAQNIFIAIPTNGVHAIASNVWFHVAVSYTGDAAATNNFNFFWTRVDTNVTAANLIGTSTLSYDLPVASCDFTLGNEGRATGGSSDNFVGAIDEVRISNMARATNEFIFRSQPVLTASSYEAGSTNFPANIQDGNLGSRWSASGDGQWITFDLGRYELVSSVDLAFYLGTARTTSFDVLLGNDGVTWRTVLTNAVSSGTNLNLE
ncbi:MAG: hypothetical protein RL380_1581, partial [Verrucomicrobiota bacterium]